MKFYVFLAVVMVMENPNSYARPIKHLEKGMDFGVSIALMNFDFFFFRKTLTGN